MTTGCNIFHDKTDMPSSAVDEMDSPVRVGQATSSPKGAQVTHTISPRGMDVAHVERPRRGHDY